MNSKLKKIFFIYMISIIFCISFEFSFANEDNAIIYNASSKDLIISKTNKVSGLNINDKIEKFQKKKFTFDLKGDECKKGATDVSIDFTNGMSLNFYVRGTWYSDRGYCEADAMQYYHGKDGAIAQIQKNHDTAHMYAPFGGYDSKYVWVFGVGNNVKGPRKPIVIFDSF